MLDALFLDIKGLYDNGMSNLLFETINQLKIPWGYKNFFLNFLGARNVNFYESGSLRARRTVQKGLLQDSVLSLLLFNMYVKDILFKISHKCTSIQFVDDFVIYTRGPWPSVILDDLTSAFKGISEWLNKIGLTL